MAEPYQQPNDLESIVTRTFPHALQLAQSADEPASFRLAYSKVAPLRGVLRNVLLMWAHYPIMVSLVGPTLTPRFADMFGPDWPWMQHMTDLVNAGSLQETKAADDVVSRIYKEVDDDGLYQLTYGLAQVVADIYRISGGSERLSLTIEWLNKSCTDNEFARAVLPQASVIVAAVSSGNTEQAHNLMEKVVALADGSKQRFLYTGFIPMMMSAMANLATRDGRGKVSNVLMVFDNDGVPTATRLTAEARRSPDMVLRCAALAHDLVAGLLSGDPKARRRVTARMNKITFLEEAVLAWQLAVSTGLGLGQSLAKFEAAENGGTAAD